LAVKRARRGKEVERGYISALCAALKAWPEVAIRRNVRGASCVVGRKFFAFTRPEGLAMKLPENRIRALVEAGEAQFLKMGKRTMREWALLRLEPTAQVRDEDIRLLREAMRFTSSWRPR